MPLEDNYITLGGQKFPVRGFAEGNAASEFETGIKIGSVDYDQREHAFFHVIEDFSGGIGHRRLTRQQQGTFWDTEEDALDTRRPGHITLPPLVTDVSPDFDPSSPIGYASRPYLRADDGRWLVGVGNSIYRSDATMSTWTRVEDTLNSPNQCQAIIRTTAPGNSTQVYVALFSGSLYEESQDGITWTTNAGLYTLIDGIWWDNKLIAIQGGFGVPGTAFPIIFAVESGGALAWNLNDPNDGQAVVKFPNVSTFRNPFILGIAPGPFGESVVYFTDGRDVYWLDFFARRYHKINIDIATTSVKAGCVWEGNVVWSDGWDVWSFNSANATLKELGFPKRSGIPSSLHNYRILSLVPAGEFLYAVASFVDVGTFKTALFCYSSAGWHQLGKSWTSESTFGFMVAPIDDFTNRKFVIPYNPDTSIDFSAEFRHFSIPVSGQTPVVGTDTFEASGKVITGWIDGGFADIDGTLLRLNIDAFNLSATSTVKVEYQLDNNESGAWTQMVDANNVADVFDNATSVLYFSTTTPRQGIKFRTVRFRITLARGSTNTDSPELRALTLVYLKTPPVRSTWKFVIDVNRMIENGKTGDDTTYFIDGQPATLERVWDKLKSFWINDHQLLSLVIPSLEPTAIYVKIVDMPLTFVDFKAAIAGQGRLAITLIEPVSDG